MKAIELRIGNLINVHGKAHTVTSINCSHKDSPPHLFLTVEGDKRRHSCFLNDRVTGIPLTEEAMNMLEDYNGGDEFSSHGQHYWFDKSKGEVYRCEWIYNTDTDQSDYESFGLPKKFIHELQNLHFVLTGEELKLKA